MVPALWTGWSWQTRFSGLPGSRRYSHLKFNRDWDIPEVYGECYEAVVPKMIRGGLLVADNAINHAATLRPMLDRALADERVDAMIVPIAKGELVCRKR